MVLKKIVDTPIHTFWLKLDICEYLFKLLCIRKQHIEIHISRIDTHYNKIHRNWRRVINNK